MEKIEYKFLDNINKKDQDSLTDIFWLTSDISIQNELKKEKFKKKYLDDYLNHSYLFAAIDKSIETIIGYLIIEKDTKLFLKSYPENKRIYGPYIDLLDNYPMHLHINVNPTYQGKNIGGNLLDYGFRKSNLFSKNSGIHLITGYEARNINFYKNNKFEIIRSFNKETVFLGGRI